MTGCMRSGVVMLQTCQKKKNMAFSLNCWLKPMPKHITVPFTVHKHKVTHTMGCFTLQILYNSNDFHLNNLCMLFHMHCFQVIVLCVCVWSWNMQLTGSDSCNHGACRSQFYICAHIHTHTTYVGMCASEVQTADVRMDDMSLRQGFQG